MLSIAALRARGARSWVLLGLYSRRWRTMCRWFPSTALVNTDFWPSDQVMLGSAPWSRRIFSVCNFPALAAVLSGKLSLASSSPSRYTSAPNERSISVALGSFRAAAIARGARFPSLLFGSAPAFRSCSMRVMSPL